MENYVDAKFHDVLLNIIKREVDAAVKCIVKNDGHKSDNSSLNSTMKINYLKDVINRQNKDIELLRSELANKSSKNSEMISKSIKDNMYLNELLETQKKRSNSYAVNFKQKIKLLRFWLTTKIIKKRCCKY